MAFLIWSTGLTPPIFLPYGAKPADGGLRWSVRPATEVRNIGRPERPVLLYGTAGGPLSRVARSPDATVEDLAAAADRSNGWFALVQTDGAGGVRVVTDAGGSRPVFCAHGPGGWAVGSRALDVARITDRLRVDAASMADFLSNGSVCHPYTWYDGVRVLEPGSVTTVNADGVLTHPYWEPREPADVIGPDGAGQDWGEAVRDEVHAAVLLGVAGAGTARVLFSGGEDSRVVASLLPRELDVTLTTIIDSRNREYRLARHAAAALRRPFEWIPRPEGYYLTALGERVAVAGHGADIVYTHVFGEVAERFADADVILGGYLADALFKSVYLCNVRRVRFLPERLLAPRPEQIMGLEDAIDDGSLMPSIAAEIRRRRRAHQERVLALRPLTAGMWHDLWPLGPHCIDYVYHTVCQAVGPRVAEPFFAHRVYRLAARMPNEYRMERVAFRHAFADGLGPAAWLPTSKGYLLGLGRRSGALTARGALIWRHQLDRALRREGTQGPWPPDVDPLVPERYLSREQAEAMHAGLGAILADGDGNRLLRRDGLLNAVRWRAMTLPFDGGALDGRVGCTS